MDLYHLDNLFVGVLVTINKSCGENKYITTNFSKKLILERITKDGETFYMSIINNTFVPAEYETKKLLKGMTYATEIEPLKNYYDKNKVIDKKTIKIIEDTINEEIMSKVDNSKVYNTKNLYIGRIYNYTVDEYIRIYSTQNFSREFIFEETIVNKEKAYKEIWSNVVYKELESNAIIGEYYVQVRPFNDVFHGYDRITKNELLELERRLSNSNIKKCKKALTLKAY